jgi:hypothetical protein
MQRLTVSPNGLGFLEGSTPFTWRGDLCWPLYGKYLALGEGAAREIFIDRRSVGANTVCVAGMLTWGYPFSPDTPSYWDKLRRFVDIAAEESMRVCFVVFCDTATLMPDRAAQLAHWERFYVTLGDKDNVTLVLVNQAGHPSQNLRQDEIDQFQKPQPVAGFPALLAAKNNPFEDNPVPNPAWDFSVFCTKRNEPHWYIEAGGVSMWTVVHDQAYAPAVMFEPIRAGDKYPEALSPGKWRQLGRSLCFEGTVGGNLYSDQSSQAVPFSGTIRNCAVEFLGNIPKP